MYLNFFGLQEMPFAITPDPRFLFLSEQHREGLAHLLFGTDDGGSFVLLTGEVGTGKTTLCRTLLDQAPAGAHFALILNPMQTPLELLASICDEFGVAYAKPPTSRKLLVDALNAFLLDIHAKGERAVVIIDEAQNLDALTLEQIRLLTNLETRAHKLLKIVLIGQPELRGVLERPELRQLAQRVTARYHLLPLSAAETGAYVRHRLRVAGLTREVFTRGGVQALHRASAGIPRRINVIADRAMMGAYATQRATVDARLVRKAAREVSGTLQRDWLPVLLAVASVIPVLAGMAWVGWQSRGAQHPTVPSSVSTTPAPPSRADAAPPASAGAATSSPPAAGLSGPESDAIAAPAREPPLETLLARARDGEAAYRRLFSLWQLDFAWLEGTSACAKAQSAGLRCLFGKGDLDTVSRYNHAAVLEMHDASLERRLAVVTAVHGDRVTLDVGGVSGEFPAERVRQSWEGSFLLLWRPPPNGSVMLQEGQSGLDVIWLRRQLDRAEGIDTPPQAHASVFDRALTQRLRAFQARQQLDADGVAGEQTLVRLAAIINDPDTPTLSHRRN